jgi:hypothetical protein
MRVYKRYSRYYPRHDAPGQPRINLVRHLLLERKWQKVPLYGMPPIELFDSGKMRAKSKIRWKVELSFTMDEGVNLRLRYDKGN